MVDRNKTVEDLMKEFPRTGNRYLDLATGTFVSNIPAETVKAEPEKPKQEEETGKYTKEELEGMTMKELRDIGKPLGAKDTKKSELIDEILAKQ